MPAPSGICAMFPSSVRRLFARGMRGVKAQKSFKNFGALGTEASVWRTEALASNRPLKLLENLARA